MDTLDFRMISPRSIMWARGGRGGNIVASRATSSKPIEFQIPRMNCTISPHSAGMFKVEMKLNPEDKTHAQFCDWVSDLEESCVGTWSSTLTRSRLVYRDGFRLMFFSNTNVFDSAGKLSVDFFKAKSCSILCSLTGLWTTADKYGLRFNVKQLKFFEDALEYPVVDAAFSDNTEELMFVDDD
jgi:hypothetical protein